MEHWFRIGAAPATTDLSLRCHIHISQTDIQGYFNYTPYRASSSYWESSSFFFSEAAAVAPAAVGSNSSSSTPVQNVGSGMGAWVGEKIEEWDVPPRHINLMKQSNNEHASKPFT